ncbi:MAG: ATP-binding cassette domain-containing protein, partial [Thermoguttaceae bacterium]|nr:ATP-binding cassette domain-containing protein [Thermoguttaceae bacterium]
ATEEQIRQAAHAAMADEFIERDLSNGYETNVGPRGSALSGGQRQRIALARAIVRQPQVFLLDEATREIDLKSEIVIRQSLMNFAQGRTTVFVTHDMALLSIANKIVMMEEGRIVDVGTHVQLMERCPQYRALNEIQFNRQ